MFCVTGVQEITHFLLVLLLNVSHLSVIALLVYWCSGLINKI